jgi:hypothetical protein
MKEPDHGRVRAALLAALAAPRAGDLWKLRAELLEAGVPADSEVWPVLGGFRDYLDRMETGTSSREYSELASKMDIGAVGGIALEQILESEDGRDLAQRLLMGLVSEGLMIAATRQHVKAWKGELASVYRSAAWFLYEHLWRWAEEKKPDLPPGERRKLLDRLFAPLHDPETSEEEKTILAGRLFQVLLAARCADALG